MTFEKIWTWKRQIPTQLFLKAANNQPKREALFVNMARGFDQKKNLVTCP